MSVERIRLLLDIGDTERHMHTEKRQQITPDIRFTCDGMITKWIIAGEWYDSNQMLYPELQVWRNIGNDTYQKINGTFIEPPAENTYSIYEYDNFTAIPFQSGDVLGIFIPKNSESELRTLSEEVNSPINYYLQTSDSDSVSSYNIVDIQNNPTIMTQGYHPMVTVEIGKKHYTSNLNSLHATLLEILLHNVFHSEPAQQSIAQCISLITIVDSLSVFMALYKKYR